MAPSPGNEDSPRRLYGPEAVRVTPDAFYECKLLAVSEDGGRGSKITRRGEWFDAE